MPSDLNDASDMEALVRAAMFYAAFMCSHVGLVADVVLGLDAKKRDQVVLSGCHEFSIKQKNSAVFKGVQSDGIGV